MDIEQVRKWVADAVADGWVAKPTYPAHESVEVAASLTKEGFAVQAIMRLKGTPQWSGSQISRSRDEADMHAWGPDGLCLEVPSDYSMDSLKQGLHVCHHCRGEFERIVRLGFAGRVCPECRQKLAPTVERPGWNA